MSMVLLNVEAERNLVSCLIQEPGLQSAYIPILPTGVITDPTCLRVIEAMRTAWAGGLPPITSDVVLDMISALSETAIGDQIFLILRNQSALPMNTGTHYRMVVNAQVAREWSARIQELHDGCVSVDAAISQIGTIRQWADDSEQRLAAADGELDAQREADIAKVAAGESDERADMGISTGIPSLDAVMRGLRPGEVTVIAARTSYGKSSLALQIGLNCAKANFPTAFYSLEMPPRAVLKRVLESEFPNGVSTDARDSVSEYLRTLPLHVIESSRLDAGGIVAGATRLLESRKIKLLIVDYIQIVSAPKMPRGSTREGEVAAISRLFRQWAEHTGTPTIIVAQLNRAASGGPPRLCHLRESGAIEQDASVVILIDRTETEDGGEDALREAARRAASGAGIECSLIVAKNRNGPTGVAECVFYPERHTFVGRHAAENAEPTRPQPPPAADRAWYAKED